MILCGSRFRTLAFDRGQRSNDRGEVTPASVRGTARRSPRFGVRELSKVRIAGNAPVRECRGPAPIDTSPRQARQVAEDALAFLPVGLALDPRADRVAVLARRQFHRNQDIGLAQHVLVHNRRPLRDQPRDEAAHPAARTISSIWPRRLSQPLIGRCGAHRSASSRIRCSGSSFAS